MTRAEKTALWFTGIGIVGGTWAWQMDFDNQTRAVLAVALFIFYLFYVFLQEFSIIKRQNDLIFDLLWKMSFHIKIDDHERQEIRETIAALNKDRK